MHPSTRCLTRRRLLLCALPLLCLSAKAQDQKPEKEKEGKQIRFVCTHILPDSPSTLKLVGKSGIVEVELGTRSPGDLFALPSDGSIVLGIDSPDPEKPVTPLVIEKLPDGIKRATAVLVPTSNLSDGRKYRAFLIADSDLTGGSAYFLNLTKNTCVAKLDGKEMKMESNKLVIFRPANLSEARNSPIAILVETREEGKQGWRPLMSSTWRLRSTRIEVCIVYWNEEINLPSIKGLTLFPADEDK